jgi:hypothetical protein
VRCSATRARAWRRPRRTHRSRSESCLRTCRRRLPTGRSGRTHRGKQQKCRHALIDHGVHGVLTPCDGHAQLEAAERHRIADGQPRRRDGPGSRYDSPSAPVDARNAALMSARRAFGDSEDSAGIHLCTSRRRPMRPVTNGLARTAEASHIPKGVTGPFTVRGRGSYTRRPAVGSTVVVGVGGQHRGQGWCVRAVVVAGGVGMLRCHEHRRLRTRL